MMNGINIVLVKIFKDVIFLLKNTYQRRNIVKDIKP